MVLSLTVVITIIIIISRSIISIMTVFGYSDYVYDYEQLWRDVSGRMQGPSPEMPQTFD